MPRWASYCPCNSVFVVKFSALSIYFCGKSRSKCMLLKQFCGYIAAADSVIHYMNRGSSNEHNTLNLEYFHL